MAPDKELWLDEMRAAADLVKCEDDGLDQLREMVHSTGQVALYIEAFKREGIVGGLN